VRISSTPSSNRGRNDVDKSDRLACDTVGGADAIALFAFSFLWGAGEQFDRYRCQANDCLEDQREKHKNEVGQEGKQTTSDRNAVSGSDSAKNDKEKTDHQNGGKDVD
jgi:hypothetical protein